MLAQAPSTLNATTTSLVDLRGYQALTGGSDDTPIASGSAGRSPRHADLLKLTSLPVAAPQSSYQTNASTALTLQADQVSAIPGAPTTNVERKWSWCTVGLREI